MNWPNFISTCRVLAIPFFVYFLSYGHAEAAFATFLLASLSDALDGFLARVLNQRTLLGSFLDPVADKLLTATSFTMGAVVGLVPVWLVIIVLSRDVILSLGAMVSLFVTGKLEIVPRPLGKITTVVQLATMGAILGRPFLHFGEMFIVSLMALTVLATVVSGVEYIVSGLRTVGAHGQ